MCSWEVFPGFSHLSTLTFPSNYLLFPDITCSLHTLVPACSLPGMLLSLLPKSG